MVKGKSLIEKVWWVIPPVVVVFGIPLYDTLDEMVEFSLPLSLFIWSYGKNISCMINDLTFFGGIVAISMLGFMALGYYLTIRKSLSLRLILPIILGIIGFYGGIIVLFIIAGLTGGI